MTTHHRSIFSSIAIVVGVIGAVISVAPNVEAQYGYGYAQTQQTTVSSHRSGFAGFAVEFPSIRLGVGVGAEPGNQEGGSNFQLDIAGGPSLEAPLMRGIDLVLIPEIGYSLIAEAEQLEDDGEVIHLAHHVMGGAAIGLSFDHVFAGYLFADLLLGAEADGFSAGARAGLRIAIYDAVGLEAAYQYLTDFDEGGYSSVRALIFVDAKVFDHL
jgi:hypothetical protein